MHTTHKGTKMSSFNVKSDFPVFEILNELSSILEKTFGPHGSTTIIEDRNLRHKHTKDGWTLLKSLYSEDDLSRVILEFVKRISMRLVRTVGDGSTSAVIVSNAIAKILKEFKEKHKDIYPGDLSRMLNTVSDKIQEKIKATSKEINEDSEELYNVCLISTNNDEEVSKLVCECYKKTTKFGIVQVEMGDRPQTEVEYKDGYEMYKGYVDAMFANRVRDDQKICELDNVYFLMYEGRLGERDVKDVGKVIDYAINMKHGSLVIIANGYENAFSNFIHENVLKFKGNLPICCIEHGIGTSAGKNHFYDASVYLGCKVIEFQSKGITLESIINENLLQDYIGFSKKAIIRDNNARFFDGKGIDSEEYTILKKSLSDKIKELGDSETKFDYDSQLGALKVRYGRLNGSTAIIKVGGNSKAEIEARSFLVEDATLAARSALMRGVVPAGNIYVAYLLNSAEFREEILGLFASEEKDAVEELLSMIYNAYVEVFTIVSKLCKEEVESLIKDGKILNIRTRQREQFENTKVLNSAQTDIEIIKGAMSVIGLIGTSNQFVYFPKQFL